MRADNDLLAACPRLHKYAAIYSAVCGFVLACAWFLSWSIGQGVM